MSIRIRLVDGEWIALCAARSVEKPGDVYLDDGMHHALKSKFGQDFNSEGCWPLVEDVGENTKREAEESDNPNRDWWDRTYAAR